MGSVIEGAVGFPETPSLVVIVSRRGFAESMFLYIAPFTLKAGVFVAVKVGVVSSPV